MLFQYRRTGVKSHAVRSGNKIWRTRKRKARKDLGVSMMMYGHVYVAQISLGAQLNQTVKAIQEAEAYPGPSLIIAYSPCEEHGYDLALSHDQMRQLTATGFWPLYRFDPRRAGKASCRWRSIHALRQMPRLRHCCRSNASVASMRNSQRWLSSCGKMPPPICKNGTTSGANGRESGKIHQRIIPMPGLSGHFI